MASFNQAAEIVLGHEGGYNDNKYDKGNYVCSNLKWVKGSYPYYCDSGTMYFVGTMRGIAAPNYARYIGRVPSQAEMRALPRHVALEIYKKDFWDNIKADQIKSQEVATLFFDAKINQTGYSVYEMQRACNDLGSNLSVDGVVGNKTITAINSHNYRILHDQYKERRRDKYYEQVRLYPSQEVFLKGWLARLDSFPNLYTPSGTKPVQKATFKPNWGSIIIVLLLLIALSWYIVKTTK